MATKISEFYPGETKRFEVTLKIDGAAQDIRKDDVIFRMKRSRSDPDSQAVLTAKAELATEGSSGVAKFELFPKQTAALQPGVTYHSDIIWRVNNSTRRFVAYVQEITPPEPVSDLPEDA